jgi:bifunctional enzyme CysN/CysC
VDISRGDMICRPNNRPEAAQDIEAMVCWMTADRVLAPRTRLIVKHTSRTVKALVNELHYRIDVNTLHRDEAAPSLGLNEVGRVRLRLTQPIFCDPYSRNRATGGLILIDEATNTTVGAATITDTR